MKNIAIFEKRDYQTEAPKKIVRALNEGNRALIVMATGLGKTITCGLSLQEFFIYTSHYKILYLCDKNHALSHAEKEFLEKLGMTIISSRLYGENTDDIVKTGKSIVFASFQKLNSAKRWFQKFSRNHFDLIVVDEAHHAFAATYYSVIKYFYTGTCKIMGMTATPFRSDQKNIQNIFGPPIVNISLEEGIAMGWLADVDYHLISDELDDNLLERIIKGEVKPRKGSRWTIKQLNTKIFVRKRDDEIVKNIKYFTQGGKKTLIFCQSIKHSDYLLEFLGRKAGVVHTNRSKNQNEIVIEGFNNGTVKYLLVVDKFNEALDIPDVEVIVFLRITDSKRIFFQQLGRGLRKTLTKNKVLVLDFVANCQRLIQISQLVEGIQNFTSLQEEKEGEIIVSSPTNLYFKKLESKSFKISGTHFNFIFTDQLVKMTQVLDVIRSGMFKSWEEGKETFISGNFISSADYRQRYAQISLRLPRAPELSWPDFPGWGSISGVSPEEKRERNRYSKEDIIEQIKNLAKKLGRTPVFADFVEASILGEIASTKRIYRIFETLPKALEAAGFESVGTSPQITLNKEELIKELKSIAKKLRRNPKIRDIRSLSKQGLINTRDHMFVRAFGSFANALDAAGFKDVRHFKKRNSAMPSNQELINELKNIASNLGKVPTASDIDKEYSEKRTDNYSKIYIRRFGSWEKAIIIAELK